MRPRSQYVTKLFNDRHSDSGYYSGHGFASDRHPQRRGTGQSWQSSDCCTTWISSKLDNPGMGWPSWEGPIPRAAERLRIMSRGPNSSPVLLSTQWTSTFVTGYGFSANLNGEICSKCTSTAETQSQARGISSEDGTQEGYFAN